MELLTYLLFYFLMRKRALRQSWLQLRLYTQTLKYSNRFKIKKLNIFKNYAYIFISISTENFRRKNKLDFLKLTEDIISLVPDTSIF